MANKTGKGSKKKRTPKRSKGIHGTTKVRLSEVQKVLMGKGRYAAIVPLGRDK